MEGRTRSRVGCYSWQHGVEVRGLAAGAAVQSIDGVGNLQLSKEERGQKTEAS